MLCSQMDSENMADFRRSVAWPQRSPLGGTLINLKIRGN